MNRTGSGSWAFLLPGCFCLAVLTSGCDSPMSPADTRLEVQTDRAAYRLERAPGTYSLQITARVTNRGSRTVWLHRGCGAADHPARRLVRADQSDTEMRLGEEVCTTSPLRAPIPLRAGETYVDTTRLLSFESPNANPPITMAMRTGAFRLVYAVQSSNQVRGWDPVDLVPLEQRVSNAFVVSSPSR